jgi:hypothetical protein
MPSKILRLHISHPGWQKKSDHEIGSKLGITSETSA